jgi:hypothetical protein
VTRLLELLGLRPSEIPPATPAKGIGRLRRHGQRRLAAASDTNNSRAASNNGTATAALRGRSSKRDRRAMQRIRSQAIVYANPFAIASRRLAGDELKLREQTFLELFDLAVETDDDAEELWAHERLKEIYAEVAGDDRFPTFFDCLHWAAQATRGPA